MDLDLEARTENGWGVLAVKGEVDLYTSPQLCEALERLVGEGASSIAVDMTDVGFMDSSGLGVLVGVLKRVQERGGRMALVAPREPVKKLLAISGLDSAFIVTPSLDETIGL